MHDATWMLRVFARRRLSRLAQLDPEKCQRKVLEALIKKARNTVFVRQQDLGGTCDLERFRSRVPVRDYDAFWQEYWSKPFPNLRNCTWPGRIPWFAVSSGTSTGVTKFIPVSREMYRSNSRAGADLLVHHLSSRPESRLLAGRFFMLGGSTGLVRQGPGVLSGDLSGIAASAMPQWARLRYFPPRELDAISDWQVKIERFAERSLETRITALAGVPSWLLIFIDQLCRQAEIKFDKADLRIADIYPHLELLVHAGVAWRPYRERFKELLGGSQVQTREVYSASEGFFGVADSEPHEGLRLLLDTGIFYEFIPVDQIGSANPDCRWIADAETGVNYALVVTTCAGLWRYLVGDTVMLTNSGPPRVVVTGRTTYMLSTFGEHVIGSEVETAIAEAAESINVKISDFSVGTVFPRASEVRGGHLFVVEFSQDSSRTAAIPAERERFAMQVDASLKRQNDDYAAHREGGVGMNPPSILVMPAGGFAKWMASRGKLGGQNKVPRIMNDAELFAGLQQFAKSCRGVSRV